MSPEGGFEGIPTPEERERENAFVLLIESLKAQSRFERRKLPDGRTELHAAEGEPFFVENVVEAKSPRVKEVHELLDATFDEAEVDPPATTRKALKANSNPEREEDFFLQVATDADRKLAAVVNASYVPMVGAEGEKTGRGILAIGYAATKEDFRKRGLARELYIKAYEKAAAAAELRQEKLAMIIGEAGGDVEGFLNRMGRARVYVEHPVNVHGRQEKALLEVPYEQTPLDWNPKTGYEAEGAGTAAEHLMISLANGERHLSVSDLLLAIRTMQANNSEWEEDDFASPEAYERHLDRIASVQHYLERVIGDRQEARLLTAEEREALRDQGVMIIDHKTLADIGLPTLPPKRPMPPPPLR